MLFQATLSNNSLSCQDNLSVCKEASNDNRKLIQLLQLLNKVYMCTICKTSVNIVTVNHMPVVGYDLNGSVYIGAPGTVVQLCAGSKGLST